ncbi:phosphate regulon sensor protein PhoR [Geomicrobium sp. JCM 19037]|uniref:sensor histidine kinase n=1 Tax=Geomicrobium sp. JCM 19037 TaxID=1460634 RepID=UPI00045F1277|nr:sensor histidine kinase [Geomicrobium sp. JCM 19037]GAK03717.1 phosphate regulon sensor protein PhoR [Geomicrobium sp. JCM 19037]
MKWRSACLICLFFMLFPYTLNAEEEHSDVATYTGSDLLVLSGDWELHLGDLHPSDVSDDTFIKNVSVPHRLSISDPSLIGAPLSYRKVLDVHESERLFAIVLPDRIGHYQIWVNETLVAPYPVDKRDTQRMIPFEAQGPSVEIVINISGYLDDSGGLIHTIRFGNNEEITTYYLQQLILSYVPLSALLIIGVSYLIFFAFLPKLKQAMYYAIFCVIVGFLAIFQMDWFHMFAWHIEYRFVYGLCILAHVWLLQYIISDFAKYTNVLIDRLAIVTLFLCAFFIIMSPYQLFQYFHYLLLVTSLFLIVYSFVVLLRALRGKHPNAVYNSIGFAMLYAAMIYEMVTYEDRFFIGSIVSLGVLFHISMQIINFVHATHRSYTKIEELTAELSTLNVSMEKKVQERTQELDYKQNELLRVNEELSQLENMRKRLVENVTHELGGPLTSIRGYVKGIKDGIFSRESDRYISIVYDKTLLLERLLDDLHDISGLENGMLSMQFEKMEMISLMNRLVISYEDEMLEKQIQLQFFHHVEQAYCIADASRIEQVFTNLITNAMKFSSPGSTINVEVSVDSLHGTLIVSICDEGEGIPNKELPFVFERFYQADNGTLESEGFGIGLSICKQIIDQHNGQLLVESQVGQGSVFTFRLPYEY